jgi:hypothetical protein
MLSSMPRDLVMSLIRCESGMPAGTSRAFQTTKNTKQREQLSRLSPLSRLPWSKRPPPPPTTQTGGLLSATSSGSEKNLNCPGMHVESAPDHEKHETTRKTTKARPFAPSCTERSECVAPSSTERSECIAPSVVQTPAPPPHRPGKGSGPGSGSAQPPVRVALLTNCGIMGRTVGG